jgi:hypothetical protein
MLNIFADRRGFLPTLLDQPEQENPSVEPHHAEQGVERAGRGRVRVIRTLSAEDLLHEAAALHLAGGRRSRQRLDRGRGPGGA